MQTIVDRSGSRPVAQGSVTALATPALVLDLDAFERNLAHMAAHCRSKNIRLRPHAKTHKSVDVARAQLAAGADGICVAKVSEAEVFADGGIRNISITSPLVTQATLARAVALAKGGVFLTVVVDDGDVAERLAASARAAGETMRVMLDVDVGHHRTGVPADDQAIKLGRHLAGLEGIHFLGLQGYAGHIMHLSDLAARRAATARALSRLAAVRDALTTVGVPVAVVSGGGTGTYDIDPDYEVLTELQAGSYVFMDSEYNDIVYSTGETVPFETALTVHVTVISNWHPGAATTDGGLKAFAMTPAPEVISGAPAETRYEIVGDEHGCLIFKKETKPLSLGSVVRCRAGHCDPTVNLYDVIHCVRGNELEAMWPVSARGCSQ